MKSLFKNPYVVTIAVLLAGVFFKDDIVKMVAKMSPKMAETLSRTKSTATNVASNERSTLKQA